MAGHFILLDESVVPRMFRSVPHFLLPQRVLAESVFVAIAKENGEILILKDRNGGNAGLVLSKQESDSVKAQLRKTLGVNEKGESVGTQD